ncbi:hypothetical protein Z517_00984 [Fonsecaea pedrosoi CBS 271.37]|uniref:Unplaced genomic scaffold supercont1.1, whole genome shotgun sequence n=1 Tax=Fonsecaea pedrosoi CBS 271.37 TaxID=1442368 RepID=A0A0D2FFW8_9EURO|nr:uncharacterized protein Z517_00984 [Fonsecaea pedrosoi CBS 271.37]KIW85592.1 hypothetical protein Z517_00984 [Fonsecaea pedrosoi CBS 271.37]
MPIKWDADADARVSTYRPPPSLGWSFNARQTPIAEYPFRSTLFELYLLFAAVLATSEIKIDHSAVALRMGNECTAKAVTHRIANIKNKAKLLEADGTAAATTAAAAAPAPATGRRKRAPNAKAKSEEQVHDSEDGDKPAVKKRRTAKSAKAAAGAAGTKKKTQQPVAAPVKKEAEVSTSDDDTTAKEEDSA